MTVTRDVAEQSVEARLAAAGRNVDGLVATARRSPERVQERTKDRVAAVQLRLAKAREVFDEALQAEEEAWIECVEDMDAYLDDLDYDLDLLEAELEADLSEADEAFVAAVEDEYARWERYIDAIDARVDAADEASAARLRAAVEAMQSRKSVFAAELRRMREEPSSAPRQLVREDVDIAREELRQAAAAVRNTVS